MRFSLFVLLVSLIALGACARRSTPLVHVQEAPAPVQLSELEKTISKHEAAMDEKLDSESVLIENMDGVRTAISSRKAQTDEARIQTLESFIDQYLVNFRTYIRTQTIFENWFSQMVDVFAPSLPTTHLSKEDTISEMEKILGLEADSSLAIGERLERVDELQLAVLLNNLREKRKSSSLQERANLCVIRTREHDGSFIRYHKQFNIVMGVRYSGTGAKIDDLGATSSTSPEKTYKNDLHFSEGVGQFLNKIGFKNQTKVLIADEMDIDPEDDSHVIMGDWHNHIVMIQTGDKNHEDILSVNLKAEPLSTKEEEGVITLELPIDQISLKNVGTARIEIHTSGGDFEITDVTILSLSEDLFSVDADTGVLTLKK